MTLHAPPQGLYSACLMGSADVEKIGQTRDALDKEAANYSTE